MSNLENHTQPSSSSSKSNMHNEIQPSSSSSKSNMHNESLVDLSEDEQLQRAIKMSEKEEIFRVEIYITARN